MKGPGSEIPYQCRTPVGLRALSRCYVALLIPVFFGPYYANLHRGIGTAFAVIIAIVVSPSLQIMPPHVFMWDRPLHTLHI